MTKGKNQKTAFVFTGGGSLAAVQVGMLKALFLHQIMPNFVVGASAGAVNAVYFANEPTMEGIRSLEKIWTGLKRSEVFPLGPVSGMLRFLSLRDYFIDPLPLRQLVEQNLSFRRLEEAKLQCHLVATEFSGGTEVCLSVGPVIDALMATMAIPALFPPVVIQGQVLVDGGIANNTPISTAVHLGATRIIVLPTGFSCALEGVVRSPVATALHALNLMMSRQLVSDIEKYSHSVELIVVPPACPMEVSPYDFTKGASLITRGFELTRKWLKQPNFKANEIPLSLRSHSHGNNSSLAA